MLKVQGLYKRFGGVKAVNDCSFEIPEKAITALIGPNGSGKTTVFNLIFGTVKSDKGKIILDDREITNLAPNEISNLGLSRVFQSPKLFKNLTVGENLLLAIDNDDTKFFKNFFGSNKISKDKEIKIIEILKLVDMEKYKDKLARDLSFGQKRLVEIARAMINPHKILVLDEPVGGVAPFLRDKIANILCGLEQNGETILLIEHDMNFTFKIAQKVVVLDEGRVIAEGAPDQIKNNKQVLEAYLGE